MGRTLGEEDTDDRHEERSMNYEKSGGAGGVTRPRRGICVLHKGGVTGWFPFSRPDCSK